MWSEDNTQNLKWHFIGVGGCGMSGLAKVLLERGFAVSGSDMTASEKTSSLTRQGARVFIGHDRNHLEEDVSVVVVSTAIHPDNPEWEEAIRRGLTVLHRSQCLAWLTESQKTIAVAGAHGKTTTTSMLAAVLIGAGWDPTVVVGGSMNILDGNGRWGRGTFLVAEADESDGSFLNLKTYMPVITNIEDDHLEHYGSMKEIEDSFLRFVRQSDPEGVSVICTDCPRALALSRMVDRPVTYGLNPQARFQAVDLRVEDGMNTADVLEQGRPAGTIRTYMPGVHNIQNALGAYACARTLGLDPRSAFRGLQAYEGVGRRFQRIGEHQGVTVVDDYAHHPTEIGALLDGARSLGPDRIVAVFQPHRYTRTRQFLQAFADILQKADLTLVSDVYSAGEEPISGADAPSLVGRSTGRVLQYTGDLEQTLDILSGLVRPGDLVLTVGAGDVTTLGPKLLERLSVHD